MADPTPAPDANGVVGIDVAAIAGFAAELPDAVLVVDETARALWANKSAERLFGISLEDGFGLSGLDLIHPDDLELAALSLASVQNKDVGTPLELRLKAHDGWRLVELIGAPVGEYLLLSVRDLTDRRRWEVAHDQDARFRSLMHNASMLTMLVRADGVVEASSSALSRLLGHDQETMEGRRLSDIVVESDVPVLDAAIADACSATIGSVGSSVTVDLGFRTRSGVVIPFAITIKNLLDDPTVNGLVVSGHDISDRRVVEDALRSANSVLAATLESTADGILVVDSAGDIRSFNRRFAEMWKMPQDVLDSRNDDRAIAVAMSQISDPDAFARTIRDLYADPESASHDMIELLDGRIFERDSLPQRIDGEVVGRVWSFRDVTEHRVLQEELTRQAFHDALTGLANQALFRDRVDHAVARLDRTTRQLAVLFIDLDDFKTVNDSLGHPVGDELLVAVSDRLRLCLRPSDTAARLGGDEFAVLIEDLTDERQVVDIAQRIVTILREPVLLDGKLVVASASIGIAFGRAGSGLNGHDLLRNADLAMYTAKARGKSCYRVFAPEMHHAAVERLEVEAYLRGAGDRGELVVHYQPIFEMRSGRVTAVESLVRWQHPQRGLLGPGAFIEIAEETGLIDEIGEHVLVASLEQAHRWELELGAAAPAVNVNLSPHQLLDPELPDRVRRLVTQCDARPDQLILEITEGALMADPVMATTNLRRLREFGVRLAVDDFGTGYSSLAYLQRFPIDFLKIDGSFVNEMLTHPESSMVEAIVQLSHTLGLIPIAEGVESPAQVGALARFGCDLAQGYHFARPLETEAVASMLAANAAVVGPPSESAGRSVGAPIR